MFFFDRENVTRNDVEKLVESNPYMKAGLVTKRTLCDNLAVAGLLSAQLV